MRYFPVVLVLAIVCGACASSSKTTTTAKSTRRLDQSSNPLYSLTLMRQGSQLLQQRRFDAALEKFQEADELQPGNATVSNMLGLCYLRLGEYDQALQSFSTALDLAPTFTDARNNRGATYLAIGQFRMAEVDFSSVLSDATYPHRKDTLYNLGITYLQRGLNGAAEENFQRAIVQPGAVFEAYLRLASLKQENGDLDAAVSLLEEATLEFPYRVEAALTLGRLLITIDRSSDARPYLEKVIEAEPGTEMADEARRLLSDL
jgi:Tfp pilus assembly protein PilF